MKNYFSENRIKIALAAVLSAIIIGCFVLAGCTGCATWQRSCKTWQSEIAGGLDRTVNVYSYDGTLIATYKGRIDIEENESKVLFELNGKRYIYYNALVEVIEN